MKKILIALMMVFMMVVSVNADYVTLGSSSGVPTYAGAYVGPISSSFNGVNIPGGMMCVDAPKTSYFGSSWDVVVSTLEPQNLVNSRLGNAGMFQYQEMAWLLGQIPTNTTQTGEIQFAAWRITNQTWIDNTYPVSTRNVVVEDMWLDLAKNINPLSYDWSDVKIYTPINGYLSNQEFMSGSPTATPLPTSIILFLSGITSIGLMGMRKKNA